MLTTYPCCPHSARSCREYKCNGLHRTKCSVPGCIGSLAIDFTTADKLEREA